MPLLILAALLIIGLLTPAMLRGYRRYRMQSMLHGEWWSRFERDLREYTDRTRR